MYLSVTPVCVCVCVRARARTCVSVRVSGGERLFGIAQGPVCAIINLAVYVAGNHSGWNFNINQIALADGPAIQEKEMISARGP